MSREAGPLRATDRIDPAGHRAPTGAEDAGSLSYMWPELWSFTFLIGLTLLFYWKIAFAGLVLGGYDTQTYFYPYRHAAAEAITHGRLPLWNPYLFLGAPFMANIQTAVFYPFNVVFYLLPTAYAMNASVIFHIALAGSFMYAWCRFSLRLDQLSAAAGGMAFMFSGFMSAQVGHINQINVAAWLPCLMLCFDRATTRRPALWTAAGALVIAAQFLAGHSQESYMVLFIFGLYVLFRLASVPATRSRKASAASRVTMLGAGVGMVGLGIGLAMVQLLPTLELAGESIRAGGMTYPEALSFSLKPWELLNDLLPGYTTNPFSEYIGYVGVTGVVLCAAAIAKRWRCPTVLFLLGLVVIGLFFALGGYNPFWYLAYKVIPGFKLFRVPARWIYVTTFGAAGLVAIGLQATRSRLGQTRTAGPSSVVPLGLCAVGVLAVALDLAFMGRLPTRIGAPLTWTLIAGVTTSLILVSGRASHPLVVRALILGLLSGELFAASRGLDYNHPLPTELYTDVRQTEAFLESDGDVFRTLSIAQDTFDSGDKADLERLFSPNLDRAGMENYLVGTKWKEVLSPNVGLTYHLETLDGYDGGVLPLKRYAEFKRLYVPPCRGCENPDAILRNELIGPPDLAWLSLMNVKYIIADKVHDVWVQNVYYDLSNTITLAQSDSPLHLRGFVPTASTSVGLVTSLSDARDLLDGAVVARVTVRAADGSQTGFDLRAGVDTSEAQWTGETRHAKAHAIGAWNGNEQAFNYLTVLALPSLRWVDEIDITAVPPVGRLNVRGAALIDTSAGTSASLTIANDTALTTVESGDVKIYRDERVMPRAFLVGSANVVPDDNAALAALTTINPHFDQAAVLTYPPGETHHSLPYRVLNGVADALNGGPAPSLPPPATDSAGPAPDGTIGAATIASSAPERLEVRTATSRAGYLVLSDEWYPGWSVEVDGQPVTLYRTDYLLMSVLVPPGTHVVVFQYRSRYFRLALMLTLLAGVCTLGLPLAAARRLGRKQYLERAPAARSQ